MCKKMVKARICVEGICRTADIEVHPAGCMKASRTHLDIPEHLLPRGVVEVAARRGYRFDWRRERDCLILIDPEAILPEVRICGPIPHPRGTPLLRRLKRGKIYLGL